MMTLEQFRADGHSRYVEDLGEWYGDDSLMEASGYVYAADPANPKGTGCYIVTLDESFSDPWSALVIGRDEWEGHLSELEEKLYRLHYLPEYCGITNA